MLFRVLIFVLCYCFCVADEKVTETEAPDNNATVTYDYNSKQLATYLQRDNITLNCSLLPETALKNRRFLKFFKPGKLIQKPIVSKLQNIARRFIPVKCSRNYITTEENYDEHESVHNLPINSDIDDPNINERMGRARNFYKNRVRQPPKPNTKPISNVRPAPKATAVKPRQIATTIKPTIKAVTESKPKGITTKKPTPKPNLISKGQKPVTSSNVNNSKKSDEIVSTTTYNTAKTPTSTKGRNSTVLNVLNALLTPTKLSRTEKITEIQKQTSLEKESYLNWYTLTAVIGGVVVLLLCLGVVIYRIKKRKLTNVTVTSAYDSKREWQFSPIGDQTAIYSIPYGFGNPRSIDSPLNTGLTSEGNGEIHYAVLDISATANVPKKIVVEEPPYSEVIPKGHGYF